VSPQGRVSSGTCLLRDVSPQGRVSSGTCLLRDGQTIFDLKTIFYALAFLGSDRRNYQNTMNKCEVIFDSLSVP